MRSILISILIVSGLLFHNNAKAQSNENYDTTSIKLPDNWFNLDPEQDSVLGVSTELAYQLLEGKTASPVIVAVIDSGVDTEHEDLNGSIWINEDEIAGNGIDDDNNGYIDDIHGWNFIGNPNGENIKTDSYELTREYVRLSKMFGAADSAKMKKKHKKDYPYYQRVKREFESQKKRATEQYENFAMFKSSFYISYNHLKNVIGKDSLTQEIVDQYVPTDEMGERTKGMLMYAYELGIDQEQLEEGQEYFDNLMNYAYNLDFDPRPLVGDDYNNIDERYYGNNDLKGPDAMHGTHVAGIIAAQRNNNLGINGICSTAKIMSIRAVPDGDERDKDIANAIYYAVDNGAQIINMSFGKSYSPNKTAIDKAVKYAAKHDVLIVHASGNSAKNVDKKDNFPNKRFYDGKGSASNWIEVGASASGKNNEYVGSFSNYGQLNVDIFAPGVAINSTTPDNQYKDLDGTSMASPVVTGVAALLMAYFPQMEIGQIKDIILSTSRNYSELEVDQPTNDDSGETKKVLFGTLSVTGGIVNAYEAVKMAESLQVKGIKKI